MLRNPNYDIGQVISNEQEVANLYFFDGKEIFVQEIDDRFIPHPAAQEGVEMV